MEHQKWKLQVALKIRKAYGRINGLVGAYNYHCNVDLIKVGKPSSAAVAVLPPPPSAVAAPLAASTGPALGLGMRCERPRMRHQHSESMDGSMIINPQMLASSPEGPSRVERKKALPAAQLAELALVDSRRAKRILLNRQSAARWKERKLRPIVELERKLQTLHTQAIALTSQLTLLQRKITGLNTENHELKHRFQTMEQRVQLQDALNNALKGEIKHLKVLTGQAMPNGAPAMMPFAPFPPCPVFYLPNNSDQPPLNAAQQLQIQPSESQHPFQVQHQRLPLQLQLPQLQQPTGDANFCGLVHLAMQGDNHAADNSSTKRN